MIRRVAVVDGLVRRRSLTARHTDVRACGGVDFRVWPWHVGQGRCAEKVPVKGRAAPASARLVSWVNGDGTLEDSEICSHGFISLFRSIAKVRQSVSSNEFREQRKSLCSPFAPQRLLERPKSSHWVTGNRKGA